MMTKVSKVERKAIRNDLRLKERRDAEAKLPMSKSDLKELFNWVDAKLGEEGCDHTLKHSISFLRRQNLTEDSVLAWLEEEGGYCDCEVIGNIEARWRGIIGSEI